MSIATASMALRCPAAQEVEEAHQGLGFPIFAHVENATGFVVEYHGQVAVSLSVH